MDQVLGTLKGGRIVLDEPPDWPEGQRVSVTQALDDEEGLERKRLEAFRKALDEANRRYARALRNLAGDCH